MAAGLLLTASLVGCGGGAATGEGAASGFDSGGVGAAVAVCTCFGAGESSAVRLGVLAAICLSLA